MNRIRTFKQVLFVMVVALIILACLGIGGSEANATGTPLPADAATQRPTATEEPASIPQPAETPVPEPPTPARVGEAVRSESFEVTVVSAKELRRVYMGNFYYYPRENEIYGEIVVKVTNLTGSEVNVPWENVYVVVDNGDAFYPTWGGYTAVRTGKKVDGATVGVNEIVDGKATLDFEEDAFLRMIWWLDRQDGKTTVLFGFLDSPYIKVVIE